MFIKGFTYGFDGRKGAYRTPEAAASMERLAPPSGNFSHAVVCGRADIVKSVPPLNAELLAVVGVIDQRAVIELPHLGYSAAPVFL